jgi:SAM-dependent methyltransferase
VLRFGRGDELGLRDRYPPPPWPSEGYGAAHSRFVSAMLDDDELAYRFSSAARLPRHYGLGLDERVVEYPWALAQRPGGRVLDAGSALNHAHILERLLPQVEALHIVTLAPELESFAERGVSYLFCDLRDLPYRDGYFDEVISISTLEHVGMDNSRYRDPTPPADQPELEVRSAVQELCRVTRAGGRVLLTVPYGRHEDHGWFRQFDAADVRELLDGLGAAEASVAVYRYIPHGWQRSSLTQARRARYCEGQEAPGSDGAVAARAVACVAATLR